MLTCEKTRRKQVILLAMAPCSLLITQQLSAANKYYVGGATNNWSSTSSWSLTFGGSSGAPVPVSGDVVNINNSTGATRVLNYDVSGAAVTLGAITVDATGSASTKNDTLNMAANTLTTNAAMTIGYAGVGTFNQSGGTTSIVVNGSTPQSLAVGFLAGSVGNYNLGVSGGTTSQGILNVSGNETVGWSGNGNFVQYSGTHSLTGVSSILVIGYSCSNSQGAYTQAGGNLAVAGNDANGFSEYVGYAYNGVNSSGYTSFFNQIAGNNTLGTSGTTHGLCIGYAAGGYGSYILQNAATLTVYGSEAVGYGATGNLPTTYGGIFQQISGTHTVVGSLNIAQNPGSSGEFLLKSGGLNVSGDAYLGGSSAGAGGTGLFQMTGGGAIIGGTLNVLPTTGTTFNFSGGSLSVGALNLNSKPSALNWAGGILNFTTPTTIDASFALGANVTLASGMTLNTTSTLTNNGAITLTGGIFGLNGTVINNALVTGYGGVGGNNGFTNNGEILQGAGDILFRSTVTNLGNIDLAAGRSLSLTSGHLENSGTVNLNGAIISGSQTIDNNAGGSIVGRGTITAPLQMYGGTVEPQGGTLTLSGAIGNNFAVIQVDRGATLAGGFFINSGTITGNGTVTNAITNNGLIQPSEGTLNMTGVVSIAYVTSTLNAATGNELDLTGGIISGTSGDANSGKIRLTGGTIAISSTMSNSGIISGYGVLSTFGLTNTGTILFAAGSSTLNGTLNNSGGATPGVVTVQNGSVLFNDPVTNNGTFRVIAGGSATFAGGYTGGAVSPNALINTGTYALSSALISDGNFTNSGSFNVSGAQTWIAGSVFSNTAGMATFNTDAGAGGSNLSANVSGGWVTFTTTQHLAGLTVGNAGSVQVTHTGSVRSIIFAPSLAVVGTLDVTDNDLDLQAGGGSGLSNLTLLVKQGFNNGTWTGAGITSSTAAGDSTHLRALGVIQNNQSGTALYTASHPLDGFIPTNANDVLAKYTYYGDVDLSGKVDGSDYSRIDSAYLADQNNPTLYTGWFNGDFNYDGAINGSDYTLIDNAFNRQGAMLTSSIANPTAVITTEIESAAAVPEPGMGCVLASVLTLKLGRNRRVVIRR